MAANPSSEKDCQAILFSKGCSHQTGRSPTHILPAALKAHPRNKSDEEIRFIADRGGFVGATMFPPFLAKGNEATIEDYVAAIDYVIRIAGEDNVGIGTDFTQDQASSVRTISATATNICPPGMASTNSSAIFIISMRRRSPSGHITRRTIRPSSRATRRAAC